MSLNVALQSVAFYVLSCTTCAKINHRRKAKIQAKRERAEKHELETEQPGLYRHPSPFNTNPYWTEEIMMGPGPPKKNDKNASKNTSQRALNTAGPGSSYAGSTAMSSDGPSSPTAVTEGSRISGEGWNRKRYQREDEALWGHDFPGPGQRIMDAIAKAGSSAGRLLESRLSKSGLTKEEEDPRSYYMARNPPVNDLHPPVVSTAPSSRDETRWMLQPPPSAKIMEGKERVNRSRASSNGSSRKGATTPLSRQVTERLVDAKVQRGEVPSQSEVGSSATRNNTRSRLTASQPKSWQIERDSSTDSISSTDTLAVRRRRNQPTPIITSRTLENTFDHAPYVVDTVADADVEMREQGSRPALGTILSSSRIIPQLKTNLSSSAQQDLLASSTNDSRASSAADRPSQLSTTSIQLPHTDAKLSDTVCQHTSHSSTENASLS